MSKVHKTDDDLLSDIREFIEVSSERAERFRTDSKTTTKIRNKPSNRGTDKPTEQNTDNIKT